MEHDYERELGFLCDVFCKCHIPARAVSLTDSVSTVFSSESASFFRVAEEGVSVRQFFGEISSHTLYKTADGLHRCYSYLLLPDGKDSTVLFIGPYLDRELSPSQVLELAEKMEIPPKFQRYFNEYFSSIPCLPEGSQLFILLNTFCERIWSSPSFSIVDVNREDSIPVSPINETARSDNFDGILVNMKAMEQRYEFENELMRAVSLGQLHKESQLISAFSENPFEKRTPDLLRNAKNYCVIMNTLLRKAAENGGVHPVYLDNVSSDFALKIEQMPSLSETPLLMREMFRAYCRLVRKHSMNAYSLLVQKTVLLIDSDLSANLTLRTLAEQQNVTPG